jgi:hypothetical protein
MSLHDWLRQSMSQMTMTGVRYAVLRDTFTALVRRMHLPGTSFTNLFAKEKPFVCTCKTYRTMRKSKRTQLACTLEFVKIGQR